MTTTTEHDELIETNRYFAKIARERLTAILRHHNMRLPAPDDVIHEYNEAARFLDRSATKLAMSSPVGTPVETVDGPMIVAQVGTIAEAMERGREVEVVLTSDGGIAHRVWHDGTKDAGAGDLATVRYEVYTMAGAICHGYIDPVSRKIVQTG